MEELLKDFLRTALKYGATDIHFSVDAQGKLEVEMRISGKMYRLPQKAADEEAAVHKPRGEAHRKTVKRQPSTSSAPDRLV